MLKKWVVVVLAASVGLGVGAWASASSAQKTKGKSRAAATKYLMRGIMQSHCKGLGDLLKDSGPADDKAWDTAACHASCLNEMSYLLMEDGRCPDGVWAGAASKDLREGSAAVIEAIDKKDVAAASEAFKRVTGACGACHKTHKGK